jgi:hypothetical protein
MHWELATSAVESNVAIARFQSMEGAHRKGIAIDEMAERISAIKKANG